jgi:hypothetical protein
MRNGSQSEGFDVAREGEWGNNFAEPPCRTGKHQVGLDIFIQQGNDRRIPDS